MSPHRLGDYAPDTYRQEDFEEYWARGLKELVSRPSEVRFERYGLPLRGVGVDRISFVSHDGSRVSGWYARPEGPGPYPGVAVYHGYGGRGERPLGLFGLAAQGLAVLSMDCRGQSGDSDDLNPGEGASVAGWMTRGIGSPRRYYYRQVYLDAVRALDLLASFEEVDASRLAVTGASQGGGLGLAVAALSERPALVWADVPFLCDFRRAVEVVEKAPYTEITDLARARPAMQEQIWATLSYVDVLNLAEQITCPTVVTVNLWDDVCPPSTIYGMFRKIAAEDKQLRVSPYNRHEVPYENQEARLEFLVRRLNA